MSDNLQATIDYWVRVANDQQALKEKRDGNIVTLLHEKEAMWNEILGLRAEIADLQEERDHLLAANDEFQEKLRFEGETA